MTNVANIRELSLDFHPGGAYVQKPLTAHFDSFGECLFNWQNSDGYVPRSLKEADRWFAKAVCIANQLVYAGYTLSHGMRPREYFESDQWVYEFIRENGYFKTGDSGTYVKIDSGHRPISILRVSENDDTNVDVVIGGVEELTLSLVARARENLRVDEREEFSPYGEVNLVKYPGVDEPVLSMSRSEIKNERMDKAEYYPYIDGGVEALIKDFMESDESVMILMGPAGTGKTSIVAVAAQSMNLFPIYAKKSDVLLHKNFVSFVCKTSDSMMVEVDGSEQKARIDLFKKRTVLDTECPTGAYLREIEEKPRIPLIVIEDADALIAPRNQGNMQMADLLNETDGIGSNHTRKLLFTTNLTNTKSIDEALMRPGRCYAVVNCRLLTPEEAVAARKAAGLPDFAEYPTQDISLAEALRKPRKKITIEKVKPRIGF